MTKLEEVLKILEGIDKEETEGGWWETSDGAKFGAGIKEKIIEVLG